MLQIQTTTLCLSLSLFYTREKANCLSKIIPGCIPAQSQTTLLGSWAINHLEQDFPWSRLSSLADTVTSDWQVLEWHCDTFIWRTKDLFQSLFPWTFKFQHFSVLLSHPQIKSLNGRHNYLLAFCFIFWALFSCPLCILKVRSWSFYFIFHCWGTFRAFDA